MKIDIIIAYLKRYEFGHEKNFVPPITGIHLAALTIKREQLVRYQLVTEVKELLNQNPVSN